jgi:3D (Asp-Asp-Asp) domain-containing protein
MNLTRQKPNFVNFAVILAIFSDLMFPKVVAAGSNVPDFTAMAGERVQTAIVSESTPVSYLERADDAKPKRVIYVTVTAYSSTPDQTDESPFVTANGTWVHNGTLAANFLPFGVKIRLPDYSGDKIYTVEDRMNERYTYRADIWMESREAAKAFGVKKLKMEIY